MKVRVILPILLVCFCLFSEVAFGIPFDLGNKRTGNPQVDENMSSNKVNPKFKNLRFNEPLLKNFLKVYAEYVKISNDCMTTDENDPSKVLECTKKLKKLLDRNRFEEDVFAALTLRLTVGYTKLKMEEMGMGMEFPGSMEDPLKGSGQPPITKKELSLLKKYKSEIDKIYGER